jgi:DNA-binding transcriptional ArsR family regulator
MRVIDLERLAPLGEPTRCGHNCIGVFDLDADMVDRAGVTFVLDYNELERRVVDHEVGVSRPALRRFDPNSFEWNHELEVAGELCVGDLADAVDMAPQAVSNQLQRLVDRRIVEARRDGNYSYYRIIDPCVSGLLELGTCLITEGSARRRGA